MDCNFESAILTTDLENILQRSQLKGWTISTAESCTGGLLSASLTKLPGSSKIFEYGFVTYSNTAKIRMLGVKPCTLRHYGAVSEAVAQEMATGALQSSGANIAFAITGIAGPGGSELKPEGRVCFGVATRRQIRRTETMDFGPQGRNAIQQASVKHSLQLLLGYLLS